MRPHVSVLVRRGEVRLRGRLPGQDVHAWLGLAGLVCSQRHDERGLWSAERLTAHAGRLDLYVQYIQCWDRQTESGWEVPASNLVS